MENIRIVGPAPLVSIIMPAYNSEMYISESIESVLVQTYRNWELIIIDDGSTDKTSNIVKNYSLIDNRIKYIYQKNQKQGKARNNGIANSNGELIAFLDSDDLWEVQKLEIQVDFYLNNEIDLLFSDGFYFYSEQDKQKSPFKTLTGKLKGIEAFNLFLEENRIPILSVLTSKTLLNKVNGFIESENIQNVEDYHLWLKVIYSGFTIYGLPNHLVYYRQHEKQVTVSDSINTEKILFMFDSFESVPNNYQHLLIKTKLIRCKEWYLLNAHHRESALYILEKTFKMHNLKFITILTFFSLLCCGVRLSKIAFRKQINMYIESKCIK